MNKIKEWIAKIRGQDSSTLVNLYTILFLCVLVFFSGNAKTSNNGVVVPFIPIKQIYIILLLTGGSMALMLVRSPSVNFDWIMTILLVRVVLCLIPLTYINIPSSYLGNYITAFVPAFIYCFLQKNEIDIRSLTKIFLIFGGIVAGQSLLAFIIINVKGYASYFDLFYKDYFVLPFGATNELSAFLLPLLVLGDFVIEKKPWRYSYIGLLSLAIFLTKSRGGLLLGVAYLFVRIFFLHKEGEKVNIKKRLIIVGSVIVAVALYCLFIHRALLYKMIELLKGFSKDGFSFRSLFSGRIELYERFLHLIGNYPLFGNGVSYPQTDNMRPHNFLLQSLYENGIVGLAGLITFLVLAIRLAMKAHRINRYYFAFLVTIPIILLNGMLEDILLKNFIVFYGLIFLRGINQDLEKGDKLMFKGKVLLVVGGTGSFGNTIVNRFLTTNIKEIRILSRDEKKQDDMRHMYQVEYPKYAEKIKFYIGDVRDYNSIVGAFQGVDYVFHAAALKQVPSCEFYPMEAVKTNILGSNNVIDACVECHVKKAIFLSTDKAAYPINAMGMTKALMEKNVVARSRQMGKKDPVLCLTRYGNVMASRGSVIPLFCEQIEEGKQLTITNPDMTRFMMTLNDAVDLVLFAFEKGEQGDLFVQKAPAATIETLAQAVLELKESDVGYKIIGARHGEKLYEVLVTVEEMLRAEDMGDFYRVSADNRNLNYDNLEKGNIDLNTIEQYHSHNTHRLSVEEMKQLLLKLKLFGGDC